MNIHTLVLSQLATNCYIAEIGDGKAVVVDPAASPEKITAFLGSNKLELKAILLTHGHFDHTAALPMLLEETETDVYMHEADAEMLSDPLKSLSFFCRGDEFVPIDTEVYLDNGTLHFVNEGDTITLNGINFRVMHTPGHTAGSVCYLCETGGENGRGVMFAGDTLFKDSIGRSDTYSGNPVIQQQTLDKISAIEGDYDVYPGHGESTVLSVEKRYNPFIAGWV